jgi:class 3 adenylate cyclase
MESLSPAGRIQVTAATNERLRERYHFEERGEIEIKGKGRLLAYLLVGRRPPGADGPATMAS